MAARTDAARAEVLASRQALGEELVTLRASGREAVDIPGKIRRSPAKAAGVAAGSAFVVLGGPRRVFRRVRRAVGGSKEPLPTRMLPDEIEVALNAMGADGARVRGALERGFEGYLTSATKQRRGDWRRRAVGQVLLESAVPIATKLGAAAVKRASVVSGKGGRAGGPTNPGGEATTAGSGGRDPSTPTR